MPPRRQRPRAPDPPPTPAVHLDPLELLPWSTGIARGVRADVGFRSGSAEEEELEGVATDALVELMHRFDEQRMPAGGDLVGAFKGFATVEIRSRCRRHAEKLRNGGLYKTTSSDEGRRIRATALPVAPDTGEEVLGWWERDDGETCVPLDRFGRPFFRTRLARRLWRLLLAWPARLRVTNGKKIRRGDEPPAGEELIRAG